MSTLQDEQHSSSRQELASERIAGTILPKMLSTFDLLAIFVVIVFFSTNAALMSGAGAAGYVFWLLGFLTFLVPGAITTGQLGRLFPGEGSIYVWTTKAMGPFFGFLAGFSAWFPGVLGLVATAVGALPFLQYLFPSVLQAIWQQGLAILIILALSGFCASLHFRVTKTLTNVLFVSYSGAIVLLALAGVMIRVHGHAAPVNYALQNWLPTWGNSTFYGVAILGLLGVEVPLNMGVEIKDARSITRYVFWGSGVIIGLYLISTFGVLSAAPLDQQGNLVSVVAAIQWGIGGQVGQVLADVAAIIHIAFFLWVTVVFNYSFARLPFTSGLDRRLPVFVSKVNRYRIPIVAIAIQSGIAMVVTLGMYLIAPLAVPQNANLPSMVYDVIQAALTIIWCLSLVFLFLDVTIIVRAFAPLFRQQKIAPGWVFYLCAVIGSIASLIAIGVTCLNPWTSLFSEGAWVVWLACLILFCLGVGMLLYFFGERNIREFNDTDVLKAVLPE